ncbi:DUF6879 family protein [Streptomyces sp. A1-5]|uniref:DUF6879 family protein n=1 Tax=Streptomyces sp. A1-5 TaxID=2738410 RepID=UPI002E1B4789|nr:DUF6879 family protein [Streptomyces sp. A1-5]
MAGKCIERVRLIDQPTTEGQRFLLAGGLGNVAAGEDVRNLYRSEAHGRRPMEGLGGLLRGRIEAILPEVLERMDRLWHGS